MILYMASPKDSTKNPVRIYEFSKVAGYKIKIQKSVTLLYTNNVLIEKEIKITIPFSFIKNKIFRNKLNQGGERLVH